jgi:hypothetical protein
MVASMMERPCFLRSAAKATRRTAFLCSQADKDEEAYLEVHVILETAYPVKEEGAKDTEGHGRHDGPRHDPGFELGRKDEKDYDEAEYEGR